MLLHHSTITISTTLWLAAIALMVTEGLNASVADGLLSRWSVLVALGAACWTIAALINHARRVVLDVVSWEHRTTRAAASGAAAHDPSVVSIRRGGV